ncbi:MAG: hypothetical protein AAFX05_15015 [Planctomycetota bacterium]
MLLRSASVTPAAEAHETGRTEERGRRGRRDILDDPLEAELERAEAVSGTEDADLREAEGRVELVDTRRPRRPRSSVRPVSWASAAGVTDALRSSMF